MMRRAAFATLAATASLVLSGCGFHGLYGVSLPGGTPLGNHPYTVTVYFANVLDLVPESSVKVNDVAVGRVQSVDLSKAGDPSGAPMLNGWSAKVKIQVRGDVHLPTNSRAAIMMTSLLGEKYVALEAPSVTPDTTDLKDGSTIPLRSPNCQNGCTSTAPEVEEVLGSLSLLLNGGGLQQLQVITSELNKALNGNEGAVRDLISQLNSFTGALDQQKSNILTVLDQLDTLSQTLAKQTQTISDTLDTMPQALEILKDDHSKLTSLLVSLSNLGSVASNVITATEKSLTSALENLSPALEALSAAGSDLPKALRIAGTFPFPLGKALEGIRGDYANLNLYFDLSLTNELCGVNKLLCLTSSSTGNPLGGLTGQSASATPVSTSSASTQSVYEPTLLGLGG